MDSKTGHAADARAQQQADRPRIDAEAYRRLYAESVSDPDGYWGREGARLDWIKPYTKVKNTDFTLGQVSIK